MNQTVFIIGIVVIFLVFMILPQTLQRRRRDQELSGINIGDWVVSIGGIIGQVIAQNQAEVKLRISQNGELTLVRQAIRAKIPPHASFGWETPPPTEETPPTEGMKTS